MPTAWITHAGQPADDRAVDADELEVAPDLQLHLARRGVGVPPLDRAGDHVADLVAVVVDHVADGAHHPVVDLALQLLVDRQPLAEAAQARRHAEPELAVLVAGGGDHRPLRLAPQRRQPLPDVRVGEQLVLQLLALGEQYRIVREAVGEVAQAGVDRVPHLVVGVGADVADEAVDRRVDLLEDPVVDRLRDPPRRLGLEAVAERGPVVLHEPAEADEHGVEEALVVTTFHGEIDRPPEHRCRRGGTDLRLDDALEPGLHLGVVEHLERAPERVGEPVGRTPGVVGLRQPGAETPSDAGRRRAARRARRG